MSDPSISVLVAVYNTEAYIKQCLDSILAQSFTDFEVICIDDGSTDGSLDILYQYGGRDNRIVVIHQDNHGVGFTKNLALSKARGKYIMVVDSDDFIEPDTLDATFCLAEQTQAEIVGFPYGYYYEQTGEYSHNYATVNELYLPKKTVFSSQDIPSTIFQVFTPEVCNKLWLRSFLIENGLHFGYFSYAEDYYLMYWAMAIAQRISACPGKTYYHYRKGRPGSLTADDANPMVFIEPYRALLDKLVSLMLFETLKQSYVNLTLSGVVYEYTRHGSRDVREKLGEYLRNEGFEKLGLSEQKRDYFYNQNDYDLFMAISNMQEETLVAQASDNQASLLTRFFRYYRTHGFVATVRRIFRGLR
jgi:glycosyltransferase EpsH